MGDMVEQGSLFVVDADEGKSHESSTGKVTTKAIYRLLKSQGFKCALTGVDLTPDT